MGSGLFVAAEAGMIRAAFGTGEPKLISSGFFTETFVLSPDCTPMESSFLAGVADFVSGIDVFPGFSFGVDARWPIGSTGRAGVTGPGVATAGLCAMGGIDSSCASDGDG